MMTPLKNPVFNRCAMLVSVMTVFPRPIETHIIVAGCEHWWFTALRW